jgi:hypothetical protein
MKLRIVSEPCLERTSPPAGECSPEFMRWVRDAVATDPTVMLAEWVPDEYPFPAASPSEGDSPPLLVVFSVCQVFSCNSSDSLSLPDGSPLFT